MGSACGPNLLEVSDEVRNEQTGAAMRRAPNRPTQTKRPPHRARASSTDSGVSPAEDLPAVAAVTATAAAAGLSPGDTPDSVPHTISQLGSADAYPGRVAIRCSGGASSRSGGTQRVRTLETE